MEETKVPGENHRLTPSHWQLSHMPRPGFVLMQWWETACSQWRRLRPHGLKSLLVVDNAFPYLIHTHTVLICVILRNMWDRRGTFYCHTYCCIYQWFMLIVLFDFRKYVEQTEYLSLSYLVYIDCVVWFQEVCRTDWVPFIVIPGICWLCCMILGIICRTDRVPFIVIPIAVSISGISLLCCMISGSM